MKNLLDKPTVELLVKRVQALSPTAPALWGSMTPTEMLLHCNKIHGHLLSPAASPGKKTTLKEYASRCIVLYLLPKLPKNIKGPRKVETKGTIEDDAFEAQRAAFVDLLRRFPQHGLPINQRHPFFGNLNTRQWGLAGYKHADHHLRQFGV